jgi:hypothetical protein
MKPRCDCAQGINSILHDEDKKLDAFITQSGELIPRIATVKSNGNPAKGLVSNYCPFCGTKYEE